MNKQQITQNISVLKERHMGGEHRAEKFYHGACFMTGKGNIKVGWGIQ